MDHETILTESVVEHYVAGKLPAEEAACFEEHFLECAACQDAIEDAERLRRGLTFIAAEEAERATLRLGVAAALAVALRRSRILLSVLAVLVLALPTLYAWRQLGTARTQVAALAGELADQRQVQVNVPILRLTASRGAGDELRLSLPAEPQRLVFAFEPTAALERYRAWLSDDAGSVVFETAELTPSFRGELVLSLHSSLLHPGSYELRLEGPAAEPVAAGRFLLRVTAAR